MKKPRIEAENNNGKQGLRGEVSGELLCSGCEVSVWDNENVLDRDGGNGCTHMGMY